MRWEDERYVRVYTRDTAEWIALGWEAQSLFMFLLRVADRAGIVHTGRAGVRGLAGLTRMPLDVVERAAPLLLDDGCLTAREGCFIIPNFMDAQEARTSDAQRKRDQRERDRAQALSAGFAGSKAGLDAESAMSRHGVTQDGHTTSHAVTQRDEESQNATGSHTRSHDVTRGHTTSHAVTPSLAVPSRAEPNHAVPVSSAPPGASPLAATETLALALSSLPAPEEAANPDPESLRALWNRLAPPKGLQRWEAMNKARTSAARASLNDVPDIGKWESWLTHELSRPFNLGDNPSGWRADVDWLLRAKTRGLVADFNPATAPKPPPASAPQKPTKFIEM